MPTTPKPKGCLGCPLCETGKGFVPGSEPAVAPVMLVQGEAPGSTEVVESLPFSGRAGYWARRNILEVAGVDPNLCAWDNTLRCLPPKRGGSDEAYPPAAKGVRDACEAQCRQYDTWDSHPGVPLLLFGGNAARQRLGHEPVSKWHGHIEFREHCAACGSDMLLPGSPCKCNVPGPRTRRAVGITFHPSAVMRNPNLLPAVVAEVRNLVWAARRGGPEPLPEVRKGAVPWPAGNDPFVVDLEWDRMGTVTVVGVATAPDVAYSSYEVPVRMRWVRDQLRAGRVIVGHNIVGADLPHIVPDGSADLRNVRDTMLMAHLVHPHLAGAASLETKDTGVGLLGLGDLTRMYFGVPNWKHDTTDLLQYNGYDCAYNYRLYTALEQDIRRTRQEHLVLKQTRLAHVAYLMHERGLRVDSAAARVVDQKQRDQLAEASAALPFNPRSPKQVLAWFGEHGVRLKDTSRATLEKAAAEHPRIDVAEHPGLGDVWGVLLGLKSDWKTLKTWFSDDAIESGVIRPRFHATGTMVDRFSSSGPNFQNLPPALRRLVLPHDPELRWVAFDYSQIENRMLAWLAQDKTALAVYESGQDVHRMMAALIYRKRPEDVTSDERRFAKTVVHASGYCETVVHLAERLYGSRSKKAVADAAAVQGAYFAACPGIKAWHTRLSAQLEAGHVQLRNPFGRWRCVYAQNAHERLKRAAHFLGCSTAAGLINQRLLDIHSTLGLVPSLIVHDELVYAVPRGSAGDRLARKVREIMIAPVPEMNGFAVPVEGKTGDNYGKVSESNPNGLREWVA